MREIILNICLDCELYFLLSSAIYIQLDINLMLMFIDFLQVFMSIDS